MGFPCGSAGKESTCSVGDLGSTLGLGRSTEGKGYPLQYSGPENSMDCIVLGVTKSWTRQSDFHTPLRLSFQRIKACLLLPLYLHCSAQCQECNKHSIKYLLMLIVILKSDETGFHVMVLEFFSQLFQSYFT